MNRFNYSTSRKVATSLLPSMKNVTQIGSCPQIGDETYGNIWVPAPSHVANLLTNFYLTSFNFVPSPYPLHQLPLFSSAMG